MVSEEISTSLSAYGWEKYRIKKVGAGGVSWMSLN